MDDAMIEVAVKNAMKLAKRKTKDPTLLKILDTISEAKGGTLVFGNAQASSAEKISATVANPKGEAMQVTFLDKNGVPHVIVMV